MQSVSGDDDDDDHNCLTVWENQAKLSKFSSGPLFTSILATWNDFHSENALSHHYHAAISSGVEVAVVAIGGTVKEVK